MTGLKQVINNLDDGPRWQVRLTVLWRDEVLPVPISPDAREIAADNGVRLATRPGSCVAHFAVNAFTAREAIAHGIDHWETVVNEASLPNWEVVSFAIDQTDDSRLDLVY